MSEHGKDSRPRRKRHKILTNILIFGLYVVISCSLVFSELRERVDFFGGEECDLRSSPPAEGTFLNPLYRFALGFILPSTSGRVSVVSIESNLDVIQQNVCPARAFTAYLLDAIAAQKPAVIAIDRFYSEGACPAGDQDTARLITAVQNLEKRNIPLVVGQSTQPAQNDPAKSCIAITPQLSLGEKVQRGLTRLNQDVLRLPLQWPIFLSDSAKSTDAGPHSYSFSLATAGQADPTLTGRLEYDRLILPPALPEQPGQPERPEPPGPLQPYVNVTSALPSAKSLSFLCAAADKELFDRWPAMKRDRCPTQTPPIDLHDKVVVIGAENESDYPSVLGKGMYGFELQAHYVDALLSPRGYLRQLPFTLQLLSLILYFTAAEVMIPYMHIQRHPRPPLFHIESPILWGVGLWFIITSTGLLVPPLFHRFPPLEVLLGISMTLASRLLIEAWALLNEHTAGPEEEGLA